MILKVPLIKQEPNSINCGIISSYMVVKYKGYKLTLDKLKKSIKLTKKARGPVIVNGLIRLGVDSEFIIYAPYLFKNFTKSELESVAKKFKKTYEGKYAKFVLKIFSYTKHMPITIDLIKSFIRNKIPPIVSVNSSILRKKTYGKYIAHYVVVKGYKNGQFVINDPHPKFGGSLKVKPDILIASIYSRKIPEMIVIK